jgi:hypothetical protein
MVSVVNTNNSEAFKSLEMRIQEAIEEARSTCSLNSNSPDCAIAWDTVEELSAEKSHQRFNSKKTSLDNYCDLNPDADECRVYDT